jgi:hypothetical protein
VAVAAIPVVVVVVVLVDLQGMAADGAVGPVGGPVVGGVPDGVVGVMTAWSLVVDGGVVSEKVPPLCSLRDTSCVY